MISCIFENGNQASLRHVVVHALVELDGQILLVKRAGPILEAGKWGLPAGFLDRDETVEHAVTRELFEETGWEGEVISFFRLTSKPDRTGEDRQNVALEFIVKPLAKTGQPDWESSAIRWFPFDKLPRPEMLAFDHGESIKLFRKYLDKAFPLPVVV
jgi:8-oxo-dGTP diphosphatase